jgi:hypothetical protein
MQVYLPFKRMWSYDFHIFLTPKTLNFVSQCSYVFRMIVTLNSDCFLNSSNRVVFVMEGFAVRYKLIFCLSFSSISASEDEDKRGKLFPVYLAI